jgi:hypothetical protein
MTKKILGAGIVFGLFVLAVSCYAVDLTSSGNNSTSLNNTTAINVINPIDSILGNSSNKSDLWDWGDVPAGYVRKGGKIVPDAYSDSDESVMETPSMLSPNPNVDGRSAGLLVRPK